ncbi:MULTISPECIES: imidazolonepropionase-like domain-containing protein [unclassified Micromonospora]|uniref:imidazolonepropionase-like domain-containing protein n=1 Tax=unclassified Micromonospora TaxID=2617518 RepID=UPI0033BC1A7A
MRTLHTAPLLRLTPDGEPAADHAVVVSGDRIEAVGPLAELSGAYAGVRVRRWPGTLGPGLLHDGPLPVAPTPRERVHALLRSGVTAVLAEHLADPALRAAVDRGDLLVLLAAVPPRLHKGGRADLAVLDADGACLVTVVAGRIAHRRA